MIRCSAPLLEGLDNPVLDKMLEPAAYPVSSKGADGGNKEGESGPHSLLIPAGGMSTSTREDNQREESDILSPEEARGLPLKIRKLRFPNGRRNLHQKVLPRRVFLSHNVRAGISPLPSCK